jgi:hypothetical protein
MLSVALIYRHGPGCDNPPTGDLELSSALQGLLGKVVGGVDGHKVLLRLLSTERGKLATTFLSFWGKTLKIWKLSLRENE